MKDEQIWNVAPAGQEIVATLTAPHAFMNIPAHTHTHTGTSSPVVGNWNIMDITENYLQPIVNRILFHFKRYSRICLNFFIFDNVLCSFGIAVFLKHILAVVCPFWCV